MEQAPKFMRVEQSLRRIFPQLSRRQAHEAIEEGLVTWQSRRVKKGDRLPSDAVLDVAALRSHLKALAAGTPDMEIPVLEDHDEWWLIDKPAGIHCHPLSLWDRKTITHWALHREESVRETFSSNCQPTLTPHRLDVGTTGALIVAKSHAAYEMWRERFAAHRIKKTYLAWCWGRPPKTEFEIRTSIGHDPADASRMLPLGEARIRGPVLDALTHVRVLMEKEDFFLCEAEMQTGVTHQIRVHLASMGLPLLGDTLYDPNSNGRRLHCAWPQLRAVKIEFENLCLPAPRDRFITSF